MRVDTVFYHIGILIWIPALLVGRWFVQVGFADYSGYMACSLYRLTGYPCPGCGGTRAVYYLCMGDLAKSFCYHPAVCFGVVAYLHFMMLYFVRKHITKTIGQKEIRIEYYLYVFAAIVILQWIVKMVGLFV